MHETNEANSDTVVNMNKSVFFVYSDNIIYKSKIIWVSTHQLVKKRLASIHITKITSKTKLTVNTTNVPLIM